jgi:hypothetical protein
MLLNLYALDKNDTLYSRQPRVIPMVASYSTFLQLSNRTGLSRVISTKCFNFRPKYSTDDDIEEDRKSWMSGKKLCRYHEVVAFILERDKVEIVQPRDGSKTNSCIRPLLCDLSGHFDVRHRKMLVSPNVMRLETCPA